MATLRHWKQRFRADAAMVWHRHVTWAGKRTVPGQPVPEGIAPGRLRRLWENHYIRLADGTVPTPAPKVEEPVVVDPDPDVVEETTEEPAVDPEAEEAAQDDDSEDKDG